MEIAVSDVRGDGLDRCLFDFVAMSVHAVHRDSWTVGWRVGVRKGERVQEKM